jgi:hypothetical protein
MLPSDVALAPVIDAVDTAYFTSKSLGVTAMKADGTQLWHSRTTGQAVPAAAGRLALLPSDGTAFVVLGP